MYTQYIFKKLCNAKYRSTPQETGVLNYFHLIFIHSMYLVLYHSFELFFSVNKMS